MLLDPKYITCVRKTIELEIVNHEEANLIWEAHLNYKNIIFGMEIYKVMSTSQYAVKGEIRYTFILEMVLDRQGEMWIREKTNA